MWRAILLFLAVAIAHFTLSLVGFAMVLPAAFATQGGQGFWAAPGKVILASIGGVLLAPVAWLWGSQFELIHIAIVSVLFGLAAVTLMRLWKSWKLR
jgi:hypothetical protein